MHSFEAHQARRSRIVPPVPVRTSRRQQGLPPLVQGDKNGEEHEGIQVGLKEQGVGLEQEALGSNNSSGRETPNGMPRARVLDLVPLLGPNPRDGGSVEDDPADHDRVGEEADLFADARDLGQREEPPMPLGPSRPTLCENYPFARVKVGISDS
jgi:hypothetical protein